MNQVVAQKVFAVPYLFHGKRVLQLFYDDVPRSVRTDRMIGGIYPIEEIIELPPRFSGMTFREVHDEWENGTLRDQHAPGTPQPKDPEKFLKLINTLDGIIRTSHHEGEISNAKKIFKQYMGRDWTP